MNDFPPPVGRPVTMFPRPDPWADQSRREAAHRDLARRKRRRWLFPLVAVLLLAAVAGVTAVVLRLLDGDAGSDDSSTAASATTTPVTTTAPTTTLVASDLVTVDEVWLVDRGDGVFDWGVAVRTQEGAPSRRDVEVDVRLLAADGTIVDETSGVLGVIDADSAAAVAGRLEDPATDPVRIEFDIAVGTVSDSGALADQFDIRALDRDGDELTGRIRSLVSSDVGDLGILFVWRDDAGDIVATTPLEIDVLRPGVDARFAIDLADEVVPDGRPDTVFWTS